MYPAALHNIPTQTVRRFATSLGQLYTPKATANNQEYYKKGTKTQLTI